jgi:hypothetical protein
MRSIMLTYPGFQSLPRGLKQMLVTSESRFFSDARPSMAHGTSGKLAHAQPPRARPTPRRDNPPSALGAWNN